MRNNWMQSITLSLAVAAMALTLIRWRAPVPPILPAPKDDRAVLALRSGHADLERRLEALERNVRMMEGSNSEQRRLADPPQPTDLEARLDALEAQFADSAVQRRSVEGATQMSDSATPTAPATDPEQRIANLRFQAMDIGLTEEDRLVALRQLRRMRGDGRDARNGEVAMSMIRMAMRSADPAVRADVWRQMSEAGDPALIQPLLQSLANDVDEGVREEAAETLADFIDNPNVRAALEYAMTNDTSESVRVQARAALGRRCP